jgi:hypothetical protein
MDKKIVQINATVSREVAPLVTGALETLGITNASVSIGRRVLLHERKGISRLLGDKSLMDDPIQTISFLVSSEHESDVLKFIVDKGTLTLPGHGSVYSRAVDVLRGHPLCKENEIKSFAVPNRTLQNDIIGVCCIVQKGNGNDIGRVGLDTGTSIPSIIYGEGTGLRDKLGLWRITIPAEKELITLIVSSNEASELMDMMIDRGSLDRPGMGFIFMYPLGQGYMDTRFYVGASQQAASIEQIVSAIDDIKGATDWRRRELPGMNQGAKARRYLNDLVNLTLVCDEGRSADLTAAAMASGAAGATISKIRNITFGETPEKSVSPAREVSEMIVSIGQVDAILDSLEKSNAFDDETHGLLYCSPVPKACTYLGPVK